MCSLTGMFAVVAWDTEALELTACRDPFGVFPLYYRLAGDDVFVSDSLEALAQSTVIDKYYLAAFLATGYPALERTVRDGVYVVPEGSVLRWQNGRAITERYWFATRIPQRKSGDLHEDAREFRALVERAVAQHLDPGGITWADLSGGLDSSTVVSVASLEGQRHPARALGGTITHVGSIGDENETAFSNVVVQQYALRNLRFGDDWPWRDDGEPAPLTEQPSRDYVFYSRDRHVSRTLRARGARVLLSGNGPDNYLPRTTLHIPDIFWTGNFRDGVRQLWECSLAQRQRVWQTTARDLVLPVLPVRIQRWTARRNLTTPDWLRADFVSAHGFEEHLLKRSLNFHSPGLICQGRLEQRFTEMSASLPGWRGLNPIVIRHPLLYRPLVEFCLGLPHKHRTSLLDFKPILRIAMKGIVPDRVLTRRTKGSSLLPRYGWALAKERPLLRRLLTSSILADLGCIEPARLSAAVDRVAAGKTEPLRAICLALSLESWLAVRFGQYDHHVASTRRADNERAYRTASTPDGDLREAADY